MRAGLGLAGWLPASMPRSSPQHSAPLPPPSTRGRLLPFFEPTQPMEVIVRSSGRQPTAIASPQPKHKNGCDRCWLLMRRCCAARRRCTPTCPDLVQLRCRALSKSSAVQSGASRRQRRGQGAAGTSWDLTPPVLVTYKYMHAFPGAGMARSRT